MRLDDKALRELVVRLCEAELRQNGRPWAALTAGGHQDASDGGVDVRVALSDDANESGLDFIRRAHAAFQCKAEDIQPKDIIKEMKPKGRLRPAITDLVQKGGAYIIVSSKGTLTDTGLKSRLQAMHKCVANVTRSEDLLLDFYDRTRLARWASQYPGVCAWAREKAGQPIDGWRGHGEWAAPAGKPPYQADAHPRLWTGASERAPRPVADGLRELRAHLDRERCVARLVGLSGTGKTRLAQALFERDLNPDSALDPAIALYADLADDSRDRLAFLTRLQSEGLRAIVVLDNCPPAQHRRFADLCGGEGSRLSLLTLNLDVQDDQPEGSQVYRLDAASIEVTAKIVRQEPKSAQLGGDACRRIAALAGGNARLALALARSVPKGTLARFSDADLFNRLFHQGRASNDALLHTARACALVYSFNGGSGGDVSEITVLAGWAGIDVNTLGAQVAELHRRGLVQQRDIWRAVLPQVLAVHLAREALEGLLPHVLEQSLQQAPRLMRSFTRQLGLLHDSPQAQALVKRWLAPGEQPCNPSVFSEEEMAWFLNVAPVDPSSTLSALEQATLPDKGTRRDSLLRLCMTLAYDEVLFPTAVRLMARWLPAGRHDDHLERFARLFQLLASGTQAGLSTRLRMVQELLCPAHGSAHWLGFEALGAMLRAGTFYGFTSQEFGARVRGLDGLPRDQRGAWYASVLEWMCQRAQSPLRTHLQRKLLAALPGLCDEAHDAAIANALEAGVRDLIVGAGASGEAWATVKAAVRKAIGATSKANPFEAREAVLCRDRLELLESLLRPTQWIDNVRTYATVNRWRLDEAMAEVDPMTAESITAVVERLDDQVRKLGRQLAARPADINALLPELVFNPVQAREDALGQGLGEASSPALRCRELWLQMVDAFSAASPDHRHVRLLCGFLAGIARHDMPLAQEFLDDSVTHQTLGPRLLELEASLPIGAQGTQRLSRAIHAGLVPIHRFSVLKLGRATATMPPAGFAALLQSLANQPPDGLATALELLHMRLFNDVTLPGGPLAEILQCGLDLLAHPEFIRLACHESAGNSHDIGQVVRICLKDQGHTSVAPRAMARHLAEQVKLNLALHAWPLSTLLIPALLARQPIATLDVLLGDTGVSLDHVSNYSLTDNRYWPAWLDEVPAGVLINWVRSDPIIRAPRVAALCRYEQTGQTDSSPTTTPTWTALAEDLINSCPDRLPVLRAFAERLMPMSWSGSRADLVERRRALFAPYLADTEAPIAAWARDFDVTAQRQLEQLRQQELHEEQRTQRFE